MTKAERDRGSRRTTFVALAISGVLHVAALLWLGLPIPELSAPAQRLSVLPPLAEQVLLEVKTAPSVTVAGPARVAEAGGAGEAGATSAAPPRPEPRAVTPDEAVAPRPVSGEPLALAAVDSVMTDERVAQPAAEPAPVVVATLPAGESAGAGHAAQPTAPAAPAHIPGSAARAKGGGASAGSGGSGSSGGFGGITIKAGGGGPKRHPPRGMPGVGRW